MFHTLFDSQNQNIHNNIPIPKNKSKIYSYQDLAGRKSYKNFNTKGKENQTFDFSINDENRSNNIQNSMNINEKFEKTKNKVKVTLYKNGFRLNNGPFRDKSIKENEEFLEQMERGVIPHELAEEGISDLGILLVNRKTEKYPLPKNSHILNLHNNDIFNYPFVIGQNQFSKVPRPKKNNKIPIGLSRINSSKNFMSFPQKIDFNKMKDKKITGQNFSEPKDKEKDKKSFIPFSGKGRLVRNVSMKGLCVKKNLKNFIDMHQPACSISIRLFNGEIVKCKFNYTQTLRDIYYHVRRISGSNNFFLLDGFPPKLLRHYDRTIYELGLQNSLLTQKIN